VVELVELSAIVAGKVPDTSDPRARDGAAAVAEPNALATRRFVHAWGTAPWDWTYTGAAQDPLIVAPKTSPPSLRS
jgi:hypothetical protein